MHYIIILAAGIGARCGHSIPKQFALIGGKPILLHTIRKFVDKFPDMQVILVLHPDHYHYWKQINDTEEFLPTLKVVSGGRERFHSVQLALESISCDDTALIGIHDAVRPFVSEATISNAYEMAEHSGTSVPVIDMTNPIRSVEGQGNRALDRQRHKVVQTPQVFKAGILKKAYKQPFQSHFYDDGTVVEHAGFDIHLSKGNYENIKITHPQDLYIAEAIYNNLNYGSLPDQGMS